MMIPQEHTKAIWPEEQAPFHVEETPSWRARSRLFRILGGAVALVAPLLVSFPFAFLGNEASWNVSLLLTILAGVISASLLRSWWAMLIVPVAYSTGRALISSFTYGFALFVPSLLASTTLFFLVLVELGVLIGIPLGKKIEQRLQQKSNHF